MSYVEWTEDMGEISGFGGSYEEGCRAMVRAGVEFWEAMDETNSALGGAVDKFDPHYRGYEGVYGILSDDNDDAKALDAAIMAAPLTVDGRETTVGEYGATGAMHQAAVSHVFAFRRLGAEEYVRQLRERTREESSGANA